MLPLLPDLGIRGIAIIALCVLLSGMAGTVYWLDTKRAEQQQVIGRLSAERQEAIAAANANAAALAAAIEVQRQYDVVTAELTARHAGLQKKLRAITKEVRNAPTADTACSVSPVLELGLERLRQLRAATAAARSDGAAPGLPQRAPDLRR